ncbi:MAG TPA: phosphoglucosamine mutase [Bacteroidales bacterium]|nr:phosphoglucosamine mutase [Bacteroidales bacterium]
MTLIKSISGIRGTIGGCPGNALTPLDIVKFTSAYGNWLKKNSTGPYKVVTGRDARVSGSVVAAIVNNTLVSLGIDVVDLGLATTPTVEVAVTGLKASGGIILTASHNPAQWNALKLLNGRGEFLSAADGEEVLRIAAAEEFDYAEWNKLGTLTADSTWCDRHIKAVLELKYVDAELIRKAGFRIAVDAVNSVGGIAIPALLKALGVAEVIEVNCNPTGLFAHNPEPLPEHLGEISEVMKKTKADVGFVVDPDVDRLAIICEDGTMFGEEYTLTAVSDFILSNEKGTTVSNMSSSKALKDVTESHGCKYYNSAVGEVNVVEEMKRVNAVIGGEGNGGVIYPAIHYGRDALVGVALFLTHLAKSKLKCSELRKKYPDYFMAKKRMDLTGQIDMDRIAASLSLEFPGYELDRRDGIRIALPDGWLQVRKSNTEAIIRVYTEEKSREKADKLADRVINLIRLI